MKERQYRNLLQDIKVADASHACGCIGPQNGEPLCPCMMRSVKVRNGRYVRVIDYGPAPTETDDDGVSPELSAKWDATMARFGL